MKSLPFVLLAFFPSLGIALSCHNCQTGYTQLAACAVGGLPMECTEPNSMCYQSVEWFQNGSLRLARRSCWAPPDKTTKGDYCDNWSNKVGELKYCKTCTEDMCNDEEIYEPVNSCQ